MSDVSAVRILADAHSLFAGQTASVLQCKARRRRGLGRPRKYDYLLGLSDGSSRWFADHEVDVLDGPIPTLKDKAEGPVAADPSIADVSPDPSKERKRCQQTDPPT